MLTLPLRVTLLRAVSSTSSKALPIFAVDPNIGIQDHRNGTSDQGGDVTAVNFVVEASTLSTESYGTSHYVTLMMYTNENCQSLLGWLSVIWDPCQQDNASV
jgi:hypothetical protein